ncbi:hypothetical protein [Cystobacter ferrugineus]|uniref:hypothetical protein n=1 Tax=Cystobacter ferrugineus TaxID=83449 RepID=UPI001160EC43|nr:hypothetical protein [Cystobacter ferrugineus]
MKKSLMLAGLSILAVACGGQQEQEARVDNTLVLGVEEPDPNISVCGINTCPSGYHVTRYDCAPSCSDCGGVRNQTFCSITKPTFGFTACGVDTYVSALHEAVEYGAKGECNPVNGSSPMPFTRYRVRPAPSGS